MTLGFGPAALFMYDEIMLSRSLSPGARSVTRVDLRRAQRLLLALLGVAIAVSIVHYADNYLAYDRYPQSDTLPDPSATTVLVSWFVFTAAGVTGAWLFTRERIIPACVALGIYSGSGLVGVGHYAVGGTSSLAWWRHVHIVTDIACGVALLAFALWAATRFRDMPPEPTTPRSGF